MTRSKVDWDIVGCRILSVPCRAEPGTAACWYLGCESVSRVSRTWNCLLRADVSFVGRGDATSGLNAFFSSLWGNRSSGNVRGFAHTGVFVATSGLILKKSTVWGKSAAGDVEEAAGGRHLAWPRLFLGRLLTVKLSCDSSRLERAHPLYGHHLWTPKGHGHPTHTHKDV